MKDTLDSIPTKTGKLVYLAVCYIEAEHNDAMPAYAQIIRRFINGNKESVFYSFFEKHPDICGKNHSISIYQIEKILEKLCDAGLIRISKTGRKGNIYSTVKRQSKTKQPVKKSIILKTCIAQPTSWMRISISPKRAQAL